MTKAFDGLTVLELSGNQVGATFGQFFADYGADVFMVEPPGGSPLRSQPGFPFWARGKHSIELDMKEEQGRAVILDIARRADVLIETFRPGVATSLGFGYDTLREANPGLVYVSVTAFGEKSRYAGVRGYEAVVQAKVGSFAQSAGMTSRPGPAFVGAPYCSASVAQLAIHGALAALIERETSGLGQRVSTNMAHAIGAHDTWNGMVLHVSKQYPDAFQNIPPVDEEGVPTTGILFRLMTGCSADGRWMQFSQTAQRLFEAFMQAIDLGWMLEDPKWSTAPEFEEVSQRLEFWELLFERIQSKTTVEWNEVFDAHPDVWAEVFRHGSEVLEHPQLIHDNSVIEIVDPQHGPVRHLARLVRVSDEPEMDGRPAPTLDEHAALAGGAGAGRMPRQLTGAEPRRLPLEGVLILELGVQYAAPFGATVLTDLGARVVKIEQQDGDQIRWMTSFPDLSGVKVLQGKESFAVDITRPEGLALVHELVKKADVVLQSFRAGVAERRGLDAATLQAINPDLVYVSAPAYGEDGPCGHRPAYAPTIGAACGMPWRNVAASVEEGPGLDMATLKAASMRLRAGTMGTAHADGFSALGVGTALLLGLYIRSKGLGARHLNTSMLLTTSHAMADGIIDYEDRPAVPTPDHDLFGMGALYRLYEAASGWVVLAAPTTKEWSPLAASLADFTPLATDPRFASEKDRRDNDAALTAVLADVFRQKPAEYWEDYMLPLDVTCVSVGWEIPSEALYSEALGRPAGYAVDVVHPLFGEHPRLAPFVSFSRSTTQTGVGCLLGEQTDAILSELRRSPEEISQLRESGVVS